MIYVFPVQWGGKWNTDSIGTRKMVFDVDESVDVGNFNPANIKKGTQFMLVLIEQVDETDPELPEENKGTDQERLQKRMHALITQNAKKEGSKPDEVKNRLKVELKRKGIIRESTTELDIQGYSLAIYILQSWLNDGNN